MGLALPVPSHPGQGQQRARPGAKMTSLPALGPEIQVEGGIVIPALGQARGLREPFHSVWGQPQTSVALSMGDPLN